MWIGCQLSCKLCDKTSDDITTMLAQYKERVLEVSIQSDSPYGIKQYLDQHTDAPAKYDAMREYMDTVVFMDPTYVKVRDQCKLRSATCITWAGLGECESVRMCCIYIYMFICTIVRLRTYVCIWWGWECKGRQSRMTFLYNPLTHIFSFPHTLNLLLVQQYQNPAYMLKHCAPVCQTCHYLDFDTRCPVNASAPTVLTKPGDLNRLFERITTLDEYSPTIHSMPNSNPTTTMIADSSSILNGPWVVTLENFVSPEECDRLIQLGADLGYLISKDVGKQQFDGTYGLHANSGRTSTNAWCTDACYNDTMTQSVMAKMEYVTTIPEANSEFLQLLRYEVGQFYQVHHDFMPHQAYGRQQGGRILTVFLYLNDVEAGGGTNFPKLNNLTIYPKQGRALIWPSVLDELPNTKDPRTSHQALPVERGIKYGANAWLHQRDYKEVVARDCM